MELKECLEVLSLLFAFIAFFSFMAHLQESIYEGRIQRCERFGGRWMEHFSGVTTEGIFENAEGCIINNSFYCFRHGISFGYCGEIKVKEVHGVE